MSTPVVIKQSINVGGLFLPLLTLVFVVMKSMGWGLVANWSWWWVFAPIWGPVALVFAIWLVLLFGAGLIFGGLALFKR